MLLSLLIYAIVRKMIVIYYVRVSQDTKIYYDKEMEKDHRKVESLGVLILIFVKFEKEGIQNIAVQGSTAT